MKQLAYFLLSCASLMSAASCSSKNEDAKPTGPREYQVEYRVSSSTAKTADYVNYTNDTGGTTMLEDVALPVSYKFKRTMKLGDSSLILASLDGGTAASDITATILLDGKEVKKETGRGTSAQAVPVYVIGE